MVRREFRHVAEAGRREDFPGDIAIVPSNSREMIVGFWVSLTGERALKWRARTGPVALLCGMSQVGSLLAALSMLGACAPKVSAGQWQCSEQGGVSDGGASQPVSSRDPVKMPWSAGFELADSQAPPELGAAEQPEFENFCDYLKVAGYCYGDQPYAVVTEPHRPGGRFAAEFKVFGASEHQTRCVRQGVLPESAFYGAWYFIPEALKDVKIVWNLWHFQGNDQEGEPLRDLWDVSLVKGEQAGDWELVVYDRLAQNPNSTYRGVEHTPIPIGSWFHVELFLKRAADSSGKIALYQDHVQLFEQTNLKSDASKFTQWYVGDLAYGATPSDSSLYVDDVTISATLSAIQ
jgi:hypothetical protein